MRPALLWAALLVLPSGCGNSEDVGPPADGGAPEGSVDAGPIEPGDFSRFGAYGWTDLHVHLWSETHIEQYAELQSASGTTRMNIVSTEHAAALATGESPTFNAEGLLARVRRPDRFRLFAGLDLSVLATAGAEALSDELASQVAALADIGVDGLKILMRSDVVEGIRAAFGFEYLPDNPALASAFGVAAERGLPVLIHIDPAYAAHAEAALARYPDLTVVVAHLAFAGPELDVLEALLARGPRLMLEPGGQVHLAMLATAGPPARDFVIAHADRIMAGTDIGAGCTDAEMAADQCPRPEVAANQAWTLRALLETDQEFEFDRPGGYGGSGTLRATGLALPPDVLRQIYVDNAGRLLGPPKPMDCVLAADYVDGLRAHTTDEGDLARLEAIGAELRAAECP